MEGEETNTPPEAAKILRVSRRRVTQMLQRGELEVLRGSANRLATFHT